VTVVQLHPVVVVAAVKRCLKGLDANTFWFLCIAVRFFDLPDHARVHTIIAPFV
jgi:hypothetical protein